MALGDETDDRVSVGKARTRDPKGAGMEDRLREAVCEHASPSLVVSSQHGDYQPLHGEAGTCR
jgi:hypothetical protein